MEVDGYILESGVLWLKLCGRMDFDTVSRQEQSVMARVSERSLGVVLDLSGVAFLGSTGLRLLLRCAKVQHALGGKVVLCGASPLVREVLLVSGMPNAIPFFETPDEACAFAGSSRPTASPSQPAQDLFRTTTPREVRTEPPGARSL